MFIWICKYCASILNPWNTRNATCQQDGDFPLSSPSWRKRCSHTTFWEIWTIGEQQIFYHPRLSGIVTKILILPTDGDLTHSKMQSPFLAIVMMRMMTTTVMMRMIATTMKRWRLWWNHRRILLKRATSASGCDDDEDNDNGDNEDDSVQEESYLKEQSLPHRWL